MEDYYIKISNWICIDNYDIFFELNGPDFVMISNLYFGFTYLKLIDQALRYSKEDILKASQDSGKDLFEVAVYPSGETLGFYNTCSFDLSDISLIISDIETCDKLLSYIGGFSDNVKDVFKEIDFKGLIDFLVEYNLLSRFTSMVYIEELGNDNFIDYNSFVGLFEKFIYYMAHDEYYNMGLAEISNYDSENSYLYIRESIDKYGEFLNKLLLYDSNLTDNETFNIYDPNSNGAYILHKTKRDILKINPDAEINLFGKSNKNENQAIYLAKKSISKNDPYFISDATILSPEDNLFEKTKLEKYDDLDFIITNSIASELDEYEEILELYSNNKIKPAKSVLAFKSMDDVNILEKIINNDNLEALIKFSTHNIFILNPIKQTDKKGKFLFIDQSEGKDEERILGGRSRQSDLYSNYQFELFNTQIAMELTEFDKQLMKNIFNAYKNYETSDFSIINKNEYFDRETLELLYM